MPFCDNSHEAEGWTCARDSTWSKLGFCASYRYQNLARKLASHYRAALCLPGEPVPVLDQLVILVDGLDLELPVAMHRTIQARTRLVITLGVSGSLLQRVFGDCRVLDLGSVEVFEAFPRIRALLDGDGGATVSALPRALHTGFISHAVRDEALLMPVVEYLRGYFQADLFLCTDSILPGTNWQDTILAALTGQEYFICLLSEASRASHFCSFEIGVAQGLGKPIRLLSLDSSPPPAFVQHLQVMDLPRLRRQKPWLDLPDILLDELLRALSE